MKSLSQHINENKNKYEIYHKSYTDAVQEIKKYIEGQGYTYDEDQFSKEWGGFKNSRPSEGKTVKGSNILYKNGKEQKKMCHSQIYASDKSFELNIYIN